ncbi:unannotated protein [freshwater metagenome]|uniref:Unannotated protein n=1 Tax=freshwater metagenome TaxID=449393 RepID=A0A6J7UQK1_9ZZZZ
MRRQLLPTAAIRSLPGAVSVCICTASFSGCHQSSESWKARYRPVASAIPVLRALPAPRALLFWITLTRLSAIRATSDSVASVEPSSTTMTSRSVYVWSSTLFSASAMTSCRLNTGRTTETRGGSTH